MAKVEQDYRNHEAQEIMAPMSPIWSDIAKSSWDSFFSIASPASRLFYWNLIFSTLLLLIWILSRSPSIGYIEASKSTLSLIFRKKYWWNKSTKIDLALHAVNSLFKGALIVFAFDWSYLLSKKIAFFLIELNWANNTDLELSTVNGILFFGVFFLADDFSKFLFHALTHKVPWLWRFHRVHHSATTLTPVTVYRVHPIEMSLSVCRQLFLNSIFVALFIVLFQKEFSPLTFFGVTIAPFVANFIASNFRHSHVPISFGRLEYFVMSPKQHQIHHCKKIEFTDKNFGDTIGLWDWFFGTLCLSNESSRQNALWAGEPRS